LKLARAIESSIRNYTWLKMNSLELAKNILTGLKNRYAVFANVTQVFTDFDWEEVVLVLPFYTMLLLMSPLISLGIAKMIGGILGITVGAVIASFIFAEIIRTLIIACSKH